MLVLTRKMNERILIGDNIRITVVGVRGNHVRIGIEAPPEISILRDELQRHMRPRVAAAIDTAPAIDAGAERLNPAQGCES